MRKVKLDRIGVGANPILLWVKNKVLVMGSRGCKHNSFGKIRFDHFRAVQSQSHRQKKYSFGLGTMFVGAKTQFPWSPKIKVWVMWLNSCNPSIVIGHLGSLPAPTPVITTTFNFQDIRLRPFFSSLSFNYLSWLIAWPICHFFKYK